MVLGNPTVASHSLHIFGPQSQALFADVKQLVQGRTPKKWEYIDSSDHTVVASRLTSDPVYYKEYLARTFLEGLKGWLRGSRCDRARIQSHLLLRLGFHSPAVVCWGQYGKREFMISQGVPGQAFAKYIYEHWRRPLSHEQLRLQRQLIRELGQEIGRLHRLGIVHGDLRLNNILFEPTHDKPQFYFIDNERNRKYRRIPLYQIKKNLIQVNMIPPTVITLTDRLRFFRAYSQVYGRFSANQQRRLAHDIQNKAMQRLRIKSYI